MLEPQRDRRPAGHIPLQDIWRFHSNLIWYGVFFELSVKLHYPKASYHKSYFENEYVNNKNLDRWNSWWSDSRSEIKWKFYFLNLLCSH